MSINKFLFYLQCHWHIGWRKDKKFTKPVNEGSKPSVIRTTWPPSLPMIQWKISSTFPYIMIVPRVSKITVFHSWPTVLVFLKNCYNIAACLSVCLSVCPFALSNMLADFETIYIFGVPMVQRRFKNYFQPNQSRNKIFFLIYTMFWRNCKMSVR